MAISKAQLEKNAKIRDLQAKIEKEKLNAANAKEAEKKHRQALNDLRNS